MNHSFHFLWVRFRNTKDSYWISSTSEITSSISTLPRADIFSEYIKRSEVPAEWKDYSANHERFVASRKVNLLLHNMLEDAFSIVAQGLSRNAHVSKNMLKEINNTSAVVRMSLKAHLTEKLANLNISYEQFFTKLERFSMSA